MTEPSDELIARLQVPEYLLSRETLDSERREAAARITELEAENERLRAAIEWLCPVSDGFTEAFDGLMERGLLVGVPADDDYKDEWDSDTMFVWAWNARNTPTHGGHS